MIIVKVMGGLGNQLQQYALYRKMEQLGKEVRLDTSWFRQPQGRQSVLAKRSLELDYFSGLSYREASEEELRSVLGRLPEEEERMLPKILHKLGITENPVYAESGMYHPEIFDMDSRYLEGYWACDKYYADLMDKLREQISFPPSEKEENRALLQELDHLWEGTEETAVSVHIRRGDYLEKENAALFGGICTEKYYDAAIRYMKERIPKARFYLFSDDPAYLREHYQGQEYRIVDWNHGADSFYDILLMSSCAHHICANSTFSFWGARLGRNPERIRIRPSIHKNTQHCIPEEMKELWQGWVLITPEGSVL